MATHAVRYHCSMKAGAATWSAIAASSREPEKRLLTAYSYLVCTCWTLCAFEKHCHLPGHLCCCK